MTAPTPSPHPAAADIIALRPFVPALDFDKSLRFYGALGFDAQPIGEGIAVMRRGAFSFLLQAYDAESFAQHYMMHMLVPDVGAWWARIDALDLARRHGVAPPRAPAMQPWGLVVAYVYDPSGVLWHIAEDR